MTEHGWTHDGLARDLAGYLHSPERMVWLDMQLGPSGSPRPDVFTLQRSYSKPLPTAFECKVSRADLRSDTTSGKWQTYLKYAGSVTFAVPEGLCTVADIPPSCGLIVRKKEVWRYVRRATAQPVTLPMDAFMKLLIDGVSRTVDRQAPEVRRLDTWRVHEGIRQKFGEAVALAARDIVKAQTEASDLDALRRAGWDRVNQEVATHRAYMMSRVKDEMAQFEFAKRELIEWLDLNGDHSAHSVRRRLSEIKAECDADGRVRAAERKLDQARYALQSALAAMPPPAFREAAE